MADNIELRRNLWYAVLKVPKKHRERIGLTNFVQSLGTSSRPRALILAAPIIAMWKARLRQAEGESDAVQEEAMRWRDAMAQAKRDGDEEQLELVRDLIRDKTEHLDERKGQHVGARFADVALGLSTPSSEHFTEWKASILHLAQKTQDQAVKDVERLTRHFATLEGITPLAARQWIDTLHKDGTSASSVKRMMSFWRSYWRYLGSIAAVPPNSFPFTVEMIRKTPKAQKKGDGWVPFPAADVPKLWAAAQARDDAELSDLIQLAAYSGARIEELCALKVDRVGDDAFRIDDAKTTAGVREVPIHPTIKALVGRLKKDSKDGYLLSGLTFNKYGDRSNAIGKRFGRLKESLGHGKQRVFHSLRKTFVTLLEDAGTHENLTADIVGHEKPRITYGLYSGGASLKTKADALALVKYPTLTPMRLVA